MLPDGVDVPFQEPSPRPIRAPIEDGRNRSRRRRRRRRGRPRDRTPGRTSRRPGVRQRASTKVRRRRGARRDGISPCVIGCWRWTKTNSPSNRPMRSKRSRPPRRFPRAPRTATRSRWPAPRACSRSARSTDPPSPTAAAWRSPRRPSRAPRPPKAGPSSTPDDWEDLVRTLPTPERRSDWLVTLSMPIEAVDKAEAVRQFWSYIRSLGPKELPTFVSPYGRELEGTSFLLGVEHEQDPEE